jgi:hypothetical protein
MNRPSISSLSSLSRRTALGRVAAVGAALGFTTRLSSAAAQDARSEMAKHPIVGSWWVSLASTGAMDQESLASTGAMDQESVLDTFTADGTVLASVKPVSPAPPGAAFGQTFASLMHGTWTVAGPNQVALTLVRLQTDESGNYLGTVTVPAVGEVSSDGQGLSGSFTYDVADPAGNVVASGTGTFEGTRLEVQPMGTPPAGTPVA